MKKSPTLSVVIPLYNAGNLFIPFLQSLLAQNIPDWEIIIVNDGSTDGSDQIAKNYAAQHPFIKVIDQKNQGVSVATTTGLQHATGHYVAMPDSDDLLYPGMYQTLLTTALQHNLEVIQANGEYQWQNRNNQTTPIIPHNRLRSTGVIDGPTWLNKALKTRKFLHVVMLSLYKLEFLRNHQLDRMEPGLHHQDIPWTTELYYNAKRVMYLDQPFYLYRVHNKSVSHQARPDNEKVRIMHNYMHICEMLDAMNRKYQNQIKIHPIFRWQITKEALGVYHGLRGVTPPCKTQMCREILDRKFDQLMWRNAVGLKQKWRLFRYLRRIRKIATQQHP